MEKEEKRDIYLKLMSMCFTISGKFNKLAEWFLDRHLDASAKKQGWDREKGEWIEK